MDLTRLFVRRASGRGPSGRGQLSPWIFFFSSLFCIAVGAGATMLIAGSGDGGRPEASAQQAAGAALDRGDFAAEEMGQQIPEMPAPYVGSYAPPFTLTHLDGQAVSLADVQEEGKVVLLNFWASWCPPCIEEMPELQRIHETMGDKVTVVGVDIGEPPEDVRAFVDENGYDWTFLLDRDLEVTQAYRMPIRFIPTSYFIDSEGVIRSVFVGPMDEAAITRRVQAAAAGKSVEG